jgi:hypothetical protein
MFFSKWLMAAALVSMPAGAMALTWQYDLRGSSITECTVRNLEDQPYCDAFLGFSFDGSISINESLLHSGSLRNQILSWEIIKSSAQNMPDGWSEYSREWSSYGENPAALDIQLRNIFGGFGGYMSPNVHMYFSIRTDQARRPLGWFLFFMHDGPDLTIGSGGIWVDLPTGEFAHAGIDAFGTPGTLSLARPPVVPHVVPLPPAGMLLLGGLAALGAAGWRKTQQTYNRPPRLLRGCLEARRSCP